MLSVWFILDYTSVFNDLNDIWTLIGAQLSFLIKEIFWLGVILDWVWSLIGAQLSGNLLASCSRFGRGHTRATYKLSFFKLDFLSI